METFNLPSNNNDPRKVQPGDYSVTVSGLGSGSVVIEYKDGAAWIATTFGPDDSGKIGSKKLMVGPDGVIRARLEGEKLPEGCKVFVSSNAA